MPFNPYARITKETVSELLATKEREGRTLDYKLELPKANDDGRNDFLADITAMANTAGGVILFGIEEERDASGKTTSLPKGVVGLGSVTLAQEQQRLLQWHKDAVAPQVPGFDVYPIEDAIGGPVMVAQVPRSWAAPHLLKNKKWVCFYRRNEFGNQPLDWLEIRGAFAAGEGQRERIERFRNDRVGKIASEAYPVTFAGRSRLILHLVPVGAIGGEAIVDVPAFMRQRSQFLPISGGGNHRPVLEGVLTFDAVGEASGGSALLFREGIIEAVDAQFSNEVLGQATIASVAYEEHLLEAVPKYVKALRSIGCSPPLVIMLSACGVLGLRMSVSPMESLGRGSHPIDRDVLTFPPVILNSFEVDFAATLKPIFDAFWNAAGLSCSYNFDADGKFNPQRRRG
ncbi:MAG: ATP-binding protein [Planctomycetes bacterium]|nr:ATP-binding protein [Planctomycetota bacterium]